MSTMPGPARDRRGELLRSRRQPARRERADAGAGRRLLRPARTRSATTSRGQTGAGRRTDHPAFRAGGSATCASARRGCSRINGKRTVDSFHRELGRMMWDHCGMARNDAGLEKALGRIPELREEFWKNVNVPGSGEELNQALEKAGRVADFLEFAELMCRDALQREESCGGHFREEYQTPDGEALRDDEHFAYVAAWEYRGRGPDARAAQGAARRSRTSTLAAQRSYKMMRPEFTLHVWRQAGPDAPGRVRPLRGRATSAPRHVVPRDAGRGERGAHRAGEEPIAFDHDCREGICGTCGMMINGVAHGPHARHDDLPAAHAPLHGRRRRSTSSRGARGPSR